MRLCLFIFSNMEVRTFLTLLHLGLEILSSGWMCMYVSVAVFPIVVTSLVT